jgi:hypothetical protein
MYISILRARQKTATLHLGIEPSIKLSIASYASFEYAKNPIH